MPRAPIEHGANRDGRSVCALLCIAIFTISQAQTRATFAPQTIRQSRQDSTRILCRLAANTAGTTQPTRPTHGSLLPPRQTTYRNPFLSSTGFRGT
ncbi:uncharacterized protein P884DRAFT_256016 [Thermothelomyces heterothallicus CBS 202.75]|uniref:uncharacterized protein n=1 Tax=Thermothelomyces heterothallicus CBS 202.75 TaxID=1149848 RepID=UPI00374412CA